MKRLILTALLAASGCSAGHSTRSFLKDSPTTASSSSLNSEMSVERLETLPNAAPIGVLRVGKTFHQVKGCGSVERLAKLLYLPIPIPGSNVTLDDLKSEGAEEGAVLSCSSSMPGNTDLNKVLYSPDRSLYRIPVGGTSSDYYVFSGSRSRCRDNAAVLQLFGINAASTNFGKVGEIGVTDRSFRCPYNPPKMLGYLYEEAASPIKPAVIELGGSVHVIRNCSLETLTQTLGITVPTAPPRITLTDEFRSSQGHTLFCSDQKDLAAIMTLVNSESIPRVMYADRVNGIYYLPTGIENRYYYLDFTKSACPQGDSSVISRIFGSKVDGFLIKNEIPSMVTKPLPLDCSVKADGIELLQANIYSALPRDFSDLDLNDEENAKKIDKSLGNLRMFIVESTVRGRSSRLYFQSIDGKIFFEPLVSTDTGSEDAEYTAASKAEVDEALKQLAGRYLGRFAPTLLEVPSIDVDKSIGNTVLFDVCTTCSDSSKHTVLRMDPYTGIYYPEKIAATQTTAIPSATGSTNINWNIPAAKPDFQQEVHFQFQDCPKDFLNTLSLTQPDIGIFGWLDHWRSYYSPKEDDPRINVQVFSCENIVERDACFVNLSGVYTNVQLSDRISAETQACKSSKLILNQTGDVQINGDAGVRVSLSQTVNEVHWRAKNRQKVTFNYNCKTNCSAVRDIKVISVQPPFRPDQKATVQDTLMLKNLQFLYSAKSEVLNGLSLTGLSVDGVNARLLNSSFMGQALLKTGLKLSGASFYCSDCSIEAKGYAVDAVKGQLLIAASEEQSKLAALSSSGMALNLVKGSELWTQWANITGESIASLDAGLGVVRNSRALFSRSSLSLLGMNALPAFKARFLREGQGSLGLGELQLLGTRLSRIPMDQPEFVLLKQFPGSNGASGTVFIDNMSSFASVIKDGETFKEKELSDYSEFQSILRCDDAVNPVKTQFNPYGFFCGE